jgi:hypothetical protein
MKKNIITIIIAALLAAALVSCASSGGSSGTGGRTGAGRSALGTWTFEDPDNDTCGWYLANSEFYQYKGATKLSRDDTTFGRGLLRMDVDFTGHQDIDWAEVKMANDFPKSIDMVGMNVFSFDFYYNPSLRTSGSFKPKIWSSNGSKFINEAGMDIVGEEDMGNGFVKAHSEILIVPTRGFIPDMRFSIAGYMTDYKGPVFFDNITWEAR